MNEYIATFYTHLSAMITCRTLQEHLVTARMSPVPRALSSSCGTCIFYQSETPCISLMDQDAERIYQCIGASYELVKNLED